MPKVPEADKVVYPNLKPETQVKREGTHNIIPVVPKLVSQPQSEVPPVQLRKAQGRVCVKRKLT